MALKQKDFLQGAKFLREVLPDWVRDGLVTQETADRLAAKYDVAKLSEPLTKDFGRFAMAGILGLGALLIGGGLISIVASNWDALSVTMQCGLVLGLLVAFQAGVFWAQSNESHALWQHVYVLLEALTFGGAIGLLAQIFNIVSSTGNAYAVWTVSSLLLALTTRNASVAVLAVVTSTVWYFKQEYLLTSWHSDQHTYLLWIFILYPLCHVLSAFFLGLFLRSGWVCAAGTFSGLVMAVMHHQIHGWAVFMVMWPAVLFMGTQVLTHDLGRRGVEWKRELFASERIAYLWFMITLLVYSFGMFGVNYPRSYDLSNSWYLSVSLVCLGLVIFAGQLALQYCLLKHEHPVLRLCGLAGGLLATSVGCLALVSEPMPVLFNLAVVFFGATDVASGFFEKRRGLFWRGLMLLLILFCVRFLEIKTELVLKGLVMIVIGILVAWIGREFELWLKKQNMPASKDEEGDSHA